MRQAAFYIASVSVAFFAGCVVGSRPSFHSPKFVPISKAKPGDPIRANDAMIEAAREAEQMEREGKFRQPRIP